MFWQGVLDEVLRDEPHLALELTAQVKLPDTYDCYLRLFPALIFRGQYPHTQSLFSEATGKSFKLMTPSLLLKQAIYHMIFHRGGARRMSMSLMLMMCIYGL